MNSTAFTYYSHSHTKWHTELSLPRPLNKIFDRKFFGHLVFEFLVVCLLPSSQVKYIQRSQLHTLTYSASRAAISSLSCALSEVWCLI